MQWSSDKGMKVDTNYAWIDDQLRLHFFLYTDSQLYDVEFGQMTRVGSYRVPPTEPLFYKGSGLVVSIISETPVVLGCLLSN